MSSDDLLKRNKELDKKIEEVPVGQRLRRLDRLVKWLAFSVAFDILLSVGLAVLGKVAYDASQSAQKAASQTRINCLASNQARAQSLQLWDFVLSFPPPPGESPAAKRQRVQSTVKFKKFIKKAFAPRDCNATTLRQAVSPSPTPVPSPPPPTTPTTQAQAKPTYTPQVVITVLESSHPAPASSPTHSPTPSSHSPPPSHSPSPTPRPSPTKTCIIGPPLCLPPTTGARPWQPPLSALNASTITATESAITPTQIESLVNALRPSTEVVWATRLLPSPTHLSLARLLAPWMSPTRVVISIQSSSWAIRVAIPLTPGT